MDEFFLPFEMKTVERLATPGGNFYIERFLQEVVSNLNAMHKWHSNAYNCQSKSYYVKELEGSLIKIVEGVHAISTRR